MSVCQRSSKGNLQTLSSGQYHSGHGTLTLNTQTAVFVIDGESSVIVAYQHVSNARTEIFIVPDTVSP